MKQYRKENKEKLKKWREENREKIKEYNKQWYQVNKKK